MCLIVAGRGAAVHAGELPELKIPCATPTQGWAGLTSCRSVAQRTKGQKGNRPAGKRAKGPVYVHDMACIPVGMSSSYNRAHLLSFSPSENRYTLCCADHASGICTHTKSYMTAADLRYPQSRLLSPSLAPAPPSPCRLRPLLEVGLMGWNQGTSARHQPDHL